MTPDSTQPPVSAETAHADVPAAQRLADDFIDYESLVIEDDTPVDNIFVERLYKLLTGTLYQGWSGPGQGRTYLAVANVGLFFNVEKPPLVPDMMLSLDVPVDVDPKRKEKLSYYIWRMGKPPEIVFEAVSDRRGGEDTTKFRQYATIGIPYYLIYDPRGILSGEVLRSYVLHGGGYVQMPDHWYPLVGLGMTFWSGSFEGITCDNWVRWCDERGHLIPMATEIANKERERAESERRQRERLEAKLRELGIDPEA